tara:strand:+ start:971 stop:1171 length:201 start_codon:yes stop_codon:yes gene_type:complete
MEMNWLVLAIAVTAVAWIVIRRQLKKKEVAPPKEAATEETPTEEVEEEAATEETPTEEVEEGEKKD